MVLLLMVHIHVSDAADEVKPPLGTRESSIAENVRALISAPAQHLGKSAATIVAALGKPLSISSEDTPNKHQPSQIDRIKTITYEGLVISIYDVVAYEKEMLLSVRMTRNRPGILPALIGEDENAIKANYGNSEHVRGTIHDYVLTDGDDTASDMVSIDFNESKVVTVEWSYFVD